MFHLQKAKFRGKNPEIIGPFYWLKNIDEGSPNAGNVNDSSDKNITNKLLFVLSASKARVYIT